MSDFQKFLDENISGVIIQNDTGSKHTEEYNIYEDIRNLVKTERKKNNITQKQLSELTGISQANICNMEKGISKPTIESLKKIGEAFGKKLIITFEYVDGE